MPFVWMGQIPTLPNVGAAFGQGLVSGEQKALEEKLAVERAKKLMDIKTQAEKKLLDWEFQKKMELLGLQLGTKLWELKGGTAPPWLKRMYGKLGIDLGPTASQLQTPVPAPAPAFGRRFKLEGVPQFKPSLPVSPPMQVPAEVTQLSQARTSEWTLPTLAEQARWDIAKKVAPLEYIYRLKLPLEQQKLMLESKKLDILEKRANAMADYYLTRAEEARKKADMEELGRVQKSVDKIWEGFNQTHTKMSRDLALHPEALTDETFMNVYTNWKALEPLNERGLLDDARFRSANDVMALWAIKYLTRYGPEGAYSGLALDTLNTLLRPAVDSEGNPVLPVDENTYLALEPLLQPLQELGLEVIKVTDPEFGVEFIQIKPKEEEGRGLGYYLSLPLKWLLGSPGGE